VSAKSRFLGCGSFKKDLVLRPLGELDTYLPQLIGSDFVRTFICQAFAPESVEPEIKAAVDHVSLITDECQAGYPYNYERDGRIRLLSRPVRHATRHLQAGRRPFRFAGRCGAVVGYRGCNLPLTGHIKFLTGI
jgi:hypothetical protein